MSKANETVLIISFTFEQEPDAFEVLRQGGFTPLLWAEKERKNATENDLTDYWNNIEDKQKPTGIIIGADIAIGEKFLQQAKGLKAISLNCAGYEHLNTDALKRYGVRASNVPRQNFNAVADLAWGQIISLMRRIPQGDKNIRAGKWVDGVERGMAVSHKTIGIIGLGAIGKAVAKRAAGFDMDIIANDKFSDEFQEQGQPYKLRFVSRQELFEQADIIVLCCPSTAETRHIINSDSIEAMKKSAVIINPSRGDLIDTKALIQALKSGRIAGAALDVFEGEPIYESELFALENTVLTPHMGGLADREIRNVAVQSAKNMVEMLTKPDSAIGLV